ncbi:alpha/beta hydrolase [Candidatus Poribacteria bacterium]|nr:alpha/beta hydrolase [Candidatus Poribacteria bacterium]
MSKILVNGMNVHYQRTGDGPDVVMIHGIASNLALWLNIQPVLAEDFSVTTYDLRGHGYSDMPLNGYTSADMADDLNGILDSLDIKQTHLVGHSFGGLVALHYTVLHPERVIKLVLADTGVPAVETLRKSVPVLEMWIERLAKFGISVPEDKQDDINYLIMQTRILRQQSASSSGIKQRRVGGLMSVKGLTQLLESTSILNDFRETAGLTLNQIGQISQPVLISYGERSPSMATYQYLREHLSDCKSVIIQNAGHFHPVGRPEVFVKNLKTFLL